MDFASTNLEARGRMHEAWRQQEGQVIDGQFVLRQFLAGSEHSAVFLAERGGTQTERTAVKLVRAEGEQAEPLLRQWEDAANLSHPNLIRLFQAGRCQAGDAAAVYVVMEYADEILSQVLATRALSPEEAEEMLRPALRALAYLHQEGFVHGRLKPANILAVKDQLKVSSDGICRVGQRRGGAPTASPYDPPELAAGMYSPAGDVWSLGVTLVEALTQRLPEWQGPGQTEPRLPESLPRLLLDCLRRCLVQAPERRGTVAELIARLEAGASSEEAAPQPAPLAQPRYLAPAAALGLVLAGMWAGPRLFHRRENPPAASLAEQPRVPAERAPNSPAARDAAAPVSGSGPAEVLQQVLPEIPRKARNTIRGVVRIRVKVRVDPSGGVTEARLDAPSPSRYFAQLALQAARGWKFTPVTQDGRSVPREWILQFELTRTRTTVRADRAPR